MVETEVIRMKLRNTLILLVIVIALFLFIYISEIRNPESPTEKSRTVGKMLQMEKENVSKIELVYADSKHEKIVCFKDDSEQWQIEQPLKVKADQKTIERLISKAMNKNIQRTINNPGSLTEYGLDAPQVTATFSLRDGTFRILLLGDPIPTGNYVYVKQDSVPDISLAPASIVDDLTKSVSDLRDLGSSSSK